MKVTLHIPPHECGFYLTHNEHKDTYDTVEDCYDKEDFVSEEEWEKAIKEDSVWTAQWYPNTPVGCHRFSASTLEGLMNVLNRLDREEDNET
jgi:hypothetical protein